VPVWHDLTKDLREDDELVVLGVIQEQHPERCVLFADWQGFDWPILWDPFNLTASQVVPNVFAIDEYGVLQAAGLRPDRLQADFLERPFEEPLDTSRPAASWPGRPGSGPLAEILYASDGTQRDAALARHLPTLRARAEAHPEDGASRFHLGVAQRMRYDGASGQPGDFQAALDAWAAALAVNPNQYIWRRRIQQYGPRMDKPYPFYSWVDQAVAELAEQQGGSPDWIADLTAAERAEPRRGSIAPEGTGDAPLSPDPAGLIDRDSGWMTLETAVAFDTSGRAPVARVHVELRPSADGDAHWNNEVEPMQVWVDAPEGWQVDQSLRQWPAVESVVSDEVRRLEFEVQGPAGASDPATLAGYALFHACADADGVCVYRRKDFEVVLAPPAG
jgi:hypothetical protein